MCGRYKVTDHARASPQIHIITGESIEVMFIIKRKKVSHILHSPRRLKLCIRHFMKSSILRAIVAVFVCVAWAGCTTTSEVMAATGGAYTVTKAGKTGFTSLGSLRKDAYEDANEFAKSKGMIAEVISVNETPAGFARFPQIDLKFRLVSAAVRDAGVRAPSIAAQNQASHDAMGNTTQAETTVEFSKEKDFYAEMKKLGELKKDGLLTDEEFQREKQRLLDARGK